MKYTFTTTYQQKYLIWNQGWAELGNNYQTMVNYNYLQEQTLAKN